MKHILETNSSCRGVTLRVRLTELLKVNCCLKHILEMNSSCRGVTLRVRACRGTTGLDQALAWRQRSSPWAQSQPLRLEGTSSGLRSNLLIKAKSAVRSDQVAWGFIWLGLENLRGQRLQKLSSQNADFKTSVVQVLPQNSSFSRHEYPSGFKSETIPTYLS